MWFLDVFNIKLDIFFNIASLLLEFYAFISIRSYRTSNILPTFLLGQRWVFCSWNSHHLVVFLKKRTSHRINIITMCRNNDKFSNKRMLISRCFLFLSSFLAGNHFYTGWCSHVAKINLDCKNINNITMES